MLRLWLSRVTTTLLRSLGCRLQCGILQDSKSALPLLESDRVDSEWVSAFRTCRQKITHRFKPRLCGHQMTCSVRDSDAREDRPSNRFQPIPFFWVCGCELQSNKLAQFIRLVLQHVLRCVFTLNDTSPISALVVFINSSERVVQPVKVRLSLLGLLTAFFMNLPRKPLAPAQVTVTVIDCCMHLQKE